MAIRLKFALAPALFTLFAVCMPPAVMAEHTHPEGNLLFFVSGQAHHGSDVEPGGEHLEDAWGRADIVFSASRDRWRLFGEYSLTTKEHDLERFQIGFEPISDSILWLGRFHQPASVWNTEHHHGRYLQTAVTRPSIELWEDDGGLIPQHLSGALLEVGHPLGHKAGLQFSLGVGYGSPLGANELQPVDLLNRIGGGHRLSSAARLAFLPSYLGSSSLGLLYGRHDMPVRDPLVESRLGASDVRQSVYGAYVNLTAEPWHVIAVGYYLDLALRDTGAQRDESLAAGYVQVDRELPRHLTLFVRHEDTARAADSRYASLRQDFVLHGNLAGLRWDYAHRQALTIELGRVIELHGALSEARLQWSAVFP